MIDRKHDKWIACVCCWFLVALTVIGCGGSRLDRPVTFSDLESEDPLIRIRAIKWAGESNTRGAVPLLVNSLQSQDEAIRFYAIEALRRLVGTDYGYDYKAQPPRRAAAVERWRAFVSSEEWENDEH